MTLVGLPGDLELQDEAGRRATAEPGEVEEGVGCGGTYL